MLALQLTALVLLIETHYVAAWYVRMLVVTLAALCLLFPWLIRVPAVWLALALLSATRVIRFWPLEDNHQYLLAYWVLSIFLALCLARPDRSLAVSSRWLLGFMFLWAALWKGVLSPDFMDGRFYGVALLSDPRFAEKTELFAGLSSDAVAQARIYLEPTPGATDSLPQRPAAVDSGAVAGLATFLTWSTVLVEAALAFAFLLPWGRWSLPIRHLLLVGFCVVTYVIAPVVGFGWILAAMGVAQVPKSWLWWRRAYVAVFFVIMFARDIPWERYALYVRDLLLT